MHVDHQINHSGKMVLVCVFKDGFDSFGYTARGSGDLDGSDCKVKDCPSFTLSSNGKSFMDKSNKNDTAINTYVSLGKYAKRRRKSFWPWK